VQWFDGHGFADLLRSTSVYRGLDQDVREPLLGAIVERIRTRMGNRVSRRYFSVLRVGRRADGPQRQDWRRFTDARCASSRTAGLVRILRSVRARNTPVKGGHWRSDDFPVD
jgi:hypothetical protein